MVVLTQVLGYAKRVPRKFLRKGLVDSLRITVKGGHGGCGLPRYGGIGGNGGNVYVTSKEDLTLEKIRHKLQKGVLVAQPGSASSSKGIIGVSGDDLNIQIPVGITVYNKDGMKLGELNQDGTKLLVAKGGTGGCEETGYCGLKGQIQNIILDLKLIADVGLLGFPNAGKSTFLQAVSNATPKIASYPFTTIRPQIGLISYDDYRQISVADLPGLIEGAHVNVGMGHKFLKHLDRTKLLLLIVDIQGFQLSKKYAHRSCLETVVLLNKEIELYKPDLLNRPAMIIVNKMDTDNANNVFNEIKPMLRNLNEFVAHCDEKMRPEKILQFDHIIPASLMLRNHEEVTLIKDKIRSTIDQYEETKYSDDIKSAENELVKKLKRQSQQLAPNLV